MIGVDVILILITFAFNYIILIKNHYISIISILVSIYYTLD